MEIQQVIIAIIALLVGSLLWGALGGTTITAIDTSDNSSWANASLAPANAQTISTIWNNIAVILVVAGLMIFVTVVIKLSRS